MVKLDEHEQDTHTHTHPVSMIWNDKRAIALNDRLFNLVHFCAKNTYKNVLKKYNVTKITLYFELVTMN